MGVAARVAAVAENPPERLPVQAWLLGAHLLACTVPVALFTLFHPYPLQHPDPATYARVVRTMLAEAQLLVTWDPPVRYFLHFDLALLAGGSIQRLGVFQAAVYSYLLVPLAAYGLFSTARSPAAGLSAAVAATVAGVARLPPTAVVWHHWQVDTGYPFAFAALALAIGTVRASDAGDHRREVGYAALTAATVGLTLNAEPWIALFLVAGVAAAWIAHAAVRGIAAAVVLGIPASLPVLLVPGWEVHLLIFLVDVVDLYGPLFTVEAFLAGVATPGTVGTVALFGGMGLLCRRGTPVPGGRVVGFAVLAGLVTWATFAVTALSGLGTRGLYWSLSLGIPAALLQVVDAVPADHPVAGAFADLFERPAAPDWAVLLVVEVLLLSFSVFLFVATYAPPE